MPEKSLDLTKYKLKLPDAEVYFIPDFFTPEESDLYFAELSQSINWKQESIKLFGRDLPMPRLTAWYGDKSYTYSGLKNEPQPWAPVLLQLKSKIEKITGQHYNSVLLNRYRSGQDSMGWHSDNEQELGLQPGIASISFGAERRFSFRHRINKDLKPLSINLTNGSLLLMQGATQRNWLHSLPKTTKPISERINLTFRYIKT
ncbi:alpha-ketoglutarate-dependent dioxygenase AlkB family protein [Pontibacter arcticus]|uniref:Alpha-ketoglutarate-dependent dioxygenase AlkB n=1 Tax=Pontibacter arcticus TaxID=2080288 RepID=A0A364RIN1_9BACT|nr:alpha-ketoglutarate-dependent dioxygenase AlkB [Pontibacter arcticus]RAU84133.1 alpha-ketoglutarate-dependent dioxygenase AlkB [Pontibacter arcticus]